MISIYIIRHVLWLQYRMGGGPRPPRGGSRALRGALRAPTGGLRAF